MNEQGEQLATSEEVAHFLQVPVRTLDEWAYRGTGPTFFKVGRYRRYPWPSVRAWLEAGASDPAA